MIVTSLTKLQAFQRLGKDASENTQKLQCSVAVFWRIHLWALYLLTGFGACECAGQVRSINGGCLVLSGQLFLEEG